MKKLFTLLVGFVALSLATNAQTNLNARMHDGGPSTHSKRPVEIQKKAFHAGSSRAATQSILLDYDGVDDNYAATVSGGDYTRYAWEINSRYKPTDVYTLKFCAVLFDTLLYLDGQGVPAFVPRSAASFNLDSLDLIFAHSNTTGNNDTLVVTVFDRTTLNVTGIGTAQGAMTATTLWDTTIITNTSLSTGSNYAVLSMFPNLAFTTGKTFGVRVDFAGDTANKFSVAIGSRDDCAAACLAAPSAAGFNTLPYFNWDGQFPNTGLYTNQIFFDCNSTGTYEANACENIFLQNASFIPYLTLNVNYGVAISADSLRGCPGANLNLSANAFGSNDAPFTYNWATTSGNLTSTSDQQVGLIIGSGNAVVSVTVTDANNATTTSSVTVTSRGINVNITNANPFTIACGGANNTVATQISGYTTGKNYTWSTGATGTSQATIQVNTAGNYSLTVTNNAGCSATASLAVQYAGVANNLVTFSNPNPPVCEDRPVTFTNNSARQNGWTPQWNFGDGNLGFSANGVNTFANPGVYPVTLQEDSAGCTFKSNSQNVTVLAASNAQCVNNAIDDVTFANSVNLLPNPSNGNVSVIVNGVEKNISIRVYNVIGSEVKTFNASDVASTFTKSFDFSDLANGTYLVKIQTADKTAVKRLTISK
jgi:hypothetical protein